MRSGHHTEANIQLRKKKFLIRGQGGWKGGSGRHGGSASEGHLRTRGQLILRPEAMAEGNGKKNMSRTLGLL